MYDNAFGDKKQLHFNWRSLPVAVADLVLVRRKQRAMNATIEAEKMIVAGDKSFVDAGSPTNSFATFFEDDGDTGYFYAVERKASDLSIRDALHVYNVASVPERNRPRCLTIVWSRDGLKSALLLDGLAQAIFDFAAKRGYRRSGCPPPSSHWPDAGHQWNDAAMELFA